MLGVLRRNPQYRLLWTAQAVSMTGDWLNRVAILALLNLLGGMDVAVGVGLLFGIEIFVRMMPAVVFGGLAGALADRCSRRALMIGSDLIRAVVVLGYLQVDEADEVWILYFLLILQMGFGIFFQAARSAAIPATVHPDDLGKAYELSAITWSTVLCVGALLGGVLAEVIGLDGVFVCDAGTYLVSVLLLTRLKLPEHEKAAEPFRWREVLLFRDLARGVSHARERGVVWAVLAKTFWGPAGGYLVLLPILAARHVGPEGSAADLAYYTSLYYFARGLGTGIGPVAVRLVFGSTDRIYRGQIATGFLLAAVAYVILPSVPSLAGSLICVVVAHMGGSAIWVGSTTLWQRHVREAYRGRIFSAEFAGMTASFALAGLITGVAYDSVGDWAIMLYAVSATVVLCALAWTFGGRSESRASLSSSDCG
ncbi:MAG: MFS transporter [Planctomycetes bacterium]|nr:MFS transporter [Planctomycetota bacterium]